MVVHIKVILNNIFVIVSFENGQVQPQSVGVLNNCKVLFQKNSGELGAVGKQKVSIDIFKKHLINVFSFLLKNNIYIFSLKLENVQSFFFRTLKKMLLKSHFRKLRPQNYFFYNTVTFNGCRSSKKIRVKRKRYKVRLK